MLIPSSASCALILLFSDLCYQICPCCLCFSLWAIFDFHKDLDLTYALCFGSYFAQGNLPEWHLSISEQSSVSLLFNQGVKSKCHSERNAKSQWTTYPCCHISLFHPIFNWLIECLRKNLNLCHVIGHWNQMDEAEKTAGNVLEA